MTTRVQEFTKEILTVGNLLSDSNLSIPQYQRPYKWTGKNVTQLFADIAAHKGKSSYRLGTIVFHHDGSQKNIVDGQQRTVTLLLAARALINCRKEKIDRRDLKDQLNAIEAAMVNPSFENEISKFNIHSNYLEISRIVGRSDFTEGLIDFLLNHCEVVTFALKDVSEAFQFFDSQNARGKDLEPHDLLKAYHLREFGITLDERVKYNAVQRWENSDTEELASLFSQYLYRIRNWSRGSSARYFGKDDTNLFKGVNIDSIAYYPYVEQLRISHHFVNNYNQQYERNVDGRLLTFPFNLDQIIINGRRFFEMTSYYQEQVSRISLIELETLDGYAKKIMDVIKRYEGRNRTGDRYVQAIFDCLLIYYVDKFGTAELSRAIEKIFIWSFGLRIQMQAVQLASMDKYVLERGNLFNVLKTSTDPKDFINFNLPTISGNRSTKAEPIVELFREMKYYE